MTTEKPRIVSGMRPTGPLHLGHHFGVLVNWIELQKQYDCFYFVADWHAMTSEYADPRRIKGFVPGLVMDWVAAGLDPERCVIFQQSSIKEHAELHLLLSMLTPLGWLERCPTYKEIKQQLVQKDLNTYGFLGYPVLMCADILMYRPAAVPVGQDQLPHLEMTREIARRFNTINGEFFPEPKELLTQDCKLPGLDGRKMSKSYGNTIQLSESLDEIAPKVRGMLTDENRKRRTDPGDPKVCNLFPYHKAMTDPARLPEIEEGCRKATWGCVDCKKLLMESLTAFLEPLHERRRALEANPGRVQEILAAGNERARAFARGTMAQVREILNFNFEA
ncbi:MAG: tryptophan--tRNA ligase [Desulfovibrionaceae bacterium]